MGAMKEYYHEYLTDIDFDLMFDDEYELWLNHKEEYEQAIGDGINQNYCNNE